MSSLYTKKVMEHFQKPHNYGKIKDASGIGKVGNVACGDVMYLYIKVDKKEIIKNVKFETMGCAAAIATSSIVTDMAKGKKIEDALKIEPKDVVESLGGLPVIKVHCSLLAIDALSEAVYDYFKKNKREIPASLEAKHEALKKRHGDH